MLTKLWCWLFGHRDYAKAITGNVSPDGFPMYRWEKQKFCLCCGRENES